MPEQKNAMTEIQSMETDVLKDAIFRLVGYVREPIPLVIQFVETGTSEALRLVMTPIQSVETVVHLLAQ